MMARQQSVKRDTRWSPLAVLFDIVDMAAINAHAMNTTSFLSRKKERAGTLPNRCCWRDGGT
jgi:hypothetical protein